jgi:two-component system, OmpR family, phosphate regulon sensor histidine kinase PhoR
MVGNVKSRVLRAIVYRANLNGALLFAAAGLVGGALAVATLGTFGWWIIGAGVIGATALAVLSARRSVTAQTQQTTPAEAGAALPSRVREVLETIADPFMLIDSGGRVVFANAAMQALAGTDAEKKQVAAVIRVPAVLEALEHTSGTGEPSSTEYAERVPVERHYEARLARSAGEPHLAALLLHDLTALKRAEQARADFIANASHELRTPLASLTGFIETLRGHARHDEAARERFLVIMQEEAERMRRLIDDLLSLTRIELNEHVLPSGEVQLGDIVRDAVATLAPIAKAEDVALVSDIPSDLPPVRGARDDLVQAFQNLIHNGIKYGRPGGHVWISLSAPAEASAYGRGGRPMISATVRDDGEGIPREAIPRLTERFYRVDIKRSRERGGTGLGLAIVKHIVNRHQGRLMIESRAGEGSSFTILLPIAAAEENAPAPVTELI